MQSGLSLPEEYRQRWLQEILGFSFPESQDRYATIVQHAGVVARKYLTDEIRAAFEEMKGPAGRPSVVIDGLPIDPELPPPPTDGKRPASKRTWVSEFVLIGLLEAVGLYVFAYLEEKEGALVHEVAPIPGKEQSSSNACREIFGFHTDNAIHLRPYRVEFISLLGLVNPDRVETMIATRDDILNELEPCHADTLRRPLFRFPSPESFIYSGGKGILSEPRPILYPSLRWQGEELAVATYNVKPIDKDGESAVQALSAAAARVARSIVLQPGTCCTFNNVLTLHGRGRIESVRWIQRAYAVMSLDALRDHHFAKDDGLVRRFRSQGFILD
jgi:L-asparagine oxygenase